MRTFLRGFGSQSGYHRVSHFVLVNGKLQSGDYLIEDPTYLW